MRDASSSAALRRVVLLLVALGLVIGLIVWMQRGNSPAPEATPSASPADAARSWETEVIRSAMSARPQPGNPERDE